MSKIKTKVKNVIVIPIIQVACFDERGQQIPELQKDIYADLEHFLSMAKKDGYDVSEVIIK